MAAPSPRARKAQAHVDLATALFQEQSYAEALAELRKAEPLLAGAPAQVAVRFNIARCLEEMKRPAEALAAYGLYLASGEQGPKRERAEAAVARLKAEHFGRLELDFRAVLRVLRERVADAAGLIEDGSALGEERPVLGRDLDVARLRPPDPRPPPPDAAPDLIGSFTEGGAEARLDLASGRRGVVRRAPRRAAGLLRGF